VSGEDDLVDRLRRELREVDLATEELVRDSLAEARARVRDLLTTVLTDELLDQALALLGQQRGPGRGTPPAAREHRASDEDAAAMTARPSAPEARPLGGEGPSTTAGPPAVALESEPPSQVTYLFGVTCDARAEDLAELPSLPGGDPVRLVAADELQLLACDVDPDTLSRIGDANADDLDLLAAIATAHDGVLAAVASTRTVLPMRLGTAVADDDAARSVLRDDADAFRAELGRLAGHAEWAVTVRTFSGARAGPPAPRRASEPTDGRTYLQGRRDELTARERRRRAADDLAEAVHRRLAAHVSDARTIPPQARADATTPLLHGVYLVRHDDVDAFRGEVDGLAKELDRAVVELSGPLPPYHFVALGSALDGLHP
jgi:hypothetical protein